jgi:hypothetical protein
MFEKNNIIEHIIIGWLIKKTRLRAQLLVLTVHHRRKYIIEHNSWNFHRSRAYHALLRRRSIV